MNKSIKVIELYTIENCRACPECLFVFGDNEQRWGKGGQAIIRGEPNTFGIATKKSPMEFWNDSNFKDNRLVIHSDINFLKKKLENYQVLVFPKGGLGTGLARLHIQAPRTFLYLSQLLLNEFEFNNLQNLKG